MSTMANKALVRDLFEAINDNHFEPLEAHPGFWQTREVVPPMHHVFADWRTTHMQQLAENEMVFTYFAIEFTHVGPFAGLAPTGKRVTLEGCSLDQVQNGVVIEHNSTTTWPSVMHQLSVDRFARWPVPTPRPVLGNTSAEGHDLLAHKRVLQGLPEAIGRGHISQEALHGGVGNLMMEFGTIHAAFPDLQAEWHCLVAEGDMVAGRGTLRGTHAGDLWGFVPTGRTIAWEHFIVARVADGAIVACNHTTDWTSSTLR